MSAYTTYYVKRSDANRMLKDKYIRVYWDEDLEKLGELLDKHTPMSCENYIVVEDEYDLTSHWFVRTQW